MLQLCENTIAFLQKRFPASTVVSHEWDVSNLEGKFLFKIYPMIAQDSHSGIKQRGIVIEDLGSSGREYLLAIAQSAHQIFDEMDKSFITITDHAHPTGHKISSLQMTFAPRIILYTNKLCIEINEVIEAFSQTGILIDVVDESKMHKTLFISYGGPDEDIVKQINSKIKLKGVTTWFFPDDAQPGQKLHRTMHDGVTNHDQVLLVCSKNSLTRAGVLNEIERVLEREAKEGGSAVLIPVTLDEYVYSEWAPERSDISSQIRTRVITKIEIDGKEFDQSIDKIVKALRK